MLNKRKRWRFLQKGTLVVCWR